MSQGVTCRRLCRRVAHRRWFWLVLVAAIAVWSSHRTILTCIGGLVVVDERPVHLDLIWIRESGSRIYDVVASMFLESPRRRLVMIPHRPSRLIRAGICEPLESVSRRELAIRGVPTTRFEILGTPVRNWNEELRQLADWLEGLPDAGLVVPCSRFGSACLRQAINRVMPPGVVMRVKVVAVADPRYDETNWWQSRVGVRSMLYALLSRAYSWCGVSVNDECEEWDPDTYERSLSALAAQGLQ